MCRKYLKRIVVVRMCARVLWVGGWIGDGGYVERVGWVKMIRVGTKVVILRKCYCTWKESWRVDSREGGKPPQLVC